MQHARTVIPGGICYLLGRAEKRQYGGKIQRSLLMVCARIQHNASCKSFPGLPQSWTAAAAGSEQFVPKRPAPPRLLTLKSVILHPCLGLPGFFGQYSAHICLLGWGTGGEVNPVPSGRGRVSTFARGPPVVWVVNLHSKMVEHAEWLTSHSLLLLWRAETSPHPPPAQQNLVGGWEQRSSESERGSFWSRKQAGSATERPTPATLWWSQWTIKSLSVCHLWQTPHSCTRI